MGTNDHDGEYIEVSGQPVRAPASGILTIGLLSIDFGKLGPDVTLGLTRHCCNNSLGDCVPNPGACPDDKPIVVWRFGELAPTA